MPFKKGQSGNPTGRKPGVPDKIAQEGRELARTMVSDPTYLKRLKERLHNGELPPLLEAKLWAYAWGEPKSEKSHDDRIQVLIGFLGNDANSLPTVQVLAPQPQVAGCLSD